MSSHGCRMLFAVGVLASMTSPLVAVPPAGPDEQQIARWIKELDNDDFAVRENASRRLWQTGQGAEAALEEAIRNGTPEVVRRARALLDKFRWGIYPDTPAAIAALIQTYQSSTGEERRQSLEKLLQDDPAGLRAVLKFAEIEGDAAERRLLGEWFSRKLLAAFQRLEPGDARRERFDALIAFAYDRNRVPDNHYVAYWLLRGKLDERIAKLRARITQHPGERRFAVTLAYLHRARGDWAAARAAAERAKRGDLVHALLVEASDWKTLAARPEAINARSALRKWACRAAFARLAGVQADYDAAVGELLKRAKNEPKDFPALRVARVLLLNDRPDEALSLLASSPNRQTELFDLLCARRQYREALALADEPRPADSNEQKYLDLLKARTLYQLGEKDRARALFVQYGERIKDEVYGYWAQSLLREEYEVGLKDLAFEQCARVKSVKVNWGYASPAWGQAVFLSQVFPKRYKSADIWWEVLQQKYRDDSPAATLKRLRDLLEGKTEARTVKRWIEEVQRGEARARLEPGKPPASYPPLQAGDPHWLASADAALANGLDELANSLLEQAGTSAALIRLGDVLADKKQWARAAEHYRQAWRKSLNKLDPFTNEEHGDPLPLFLAGHALQQMGRQAEGDKLIEQSHQALLGHEMGRYEFLDALEDRGYVRDARREADLLMCVCEPDSFYFGATVRRRANAIQRKDSQKAAQYYEQSTLCLLGSMTASYRQIGSYVTVPARIHRLRAASLLAEGKLPEARRHIDMALRFCPADVDLAVTLVPELERRGHKKEADALFDRGIGPHEALCREYPRCADSHNSVAWLSACCRRNLEKAREHAQKAVELAPTNTRYLDTLAEVHFQRGDPDKSIALQSRAIELAPRKTYFRKQLKRMEAGDPSAERPVEDED